MSIVDEKMLAGGAYAKKQLFCRSGLIAWSHGSRFRLGRRLTERYRGQRLLDYGCGDGTFLALAYDLFPEAVGADVDPQQTHDCTHRFSELPGLSFVLTDDLRAGRHTHAYGLVVCMEVLEHCVEENLHRVLSDLRRLVTPDGTVIISVPIEIGPSLIFKQLGRAAAGWRALGDYKYREKYTWRELWKMVFAGKQTAISRPVFRSDFAPDRPNWFHGHKGFNWRALRLRLEMDFVVAATRFSPLGKMCGFLSSQAWFICRPR
jgi:SAM-dependent methyltransferase